MLVTSGHVGYGDGVLRVFDSSGHSMLTSHFKVVGTHERIAVPEATLPSEELITRGNRMVTVVRHRLDSPTPSRSLVAISKLAFRRYDFTIRKREIVVGLVVAVTQKPPQLAVVEPGRRHRAHYELRSADHAHSEGGHQDDPLRVAIGGDVGFTSREFSRC